ncbi:aromatic amino acid transporter [Castellaniella sp.]|uniref:aromatic amino acid transporter n=1 Tax=Castellaniella sp. TaxID=1955812 RepID=UPI002AFE9793|nr:aromatic amino acid transporter [Castellaniella sp.]
MNKPSAPLPGQTATPSVLGGTMIVAGTVIGAGMLTLPIIAAGMWTGWTLAVLVLSFFMMRASALMILRANLRYRPGASFDTVVRDTLGRGWNLLNGLSVGFVLYMLMYAYTSGGGATLQHSLGLPWPQGLVSLGFGVLLACCIFWSTRAVDRLSVILMAGMVLAFVVALSGMLPAFQWDRLLNPPTSTAPVDTLPEVAYLLATLPYFLTSFCFHASVPSLVKYYGPDQPRIARCIFYGLLIAALFYAVWILIGFGVLGRDGLQSVYAQGGNISHYLAAVESVQADAWLGPVVSIFAFLAVVTSFLGAGLGLFDYIADVCGFDDRLLGRVKTALVAFAPPVLAGTFFPDGFIMAIGFAGFAAAIWSVIIPALMDWKHARAVTQDQTRLLSFGTRAQCLLIGVVLVYGVLAAGFHLLSSDVLDILPVYR